MWPKSAAGWVRLGLATLPEVETVLLGETPDPGPAPCDVLIIDGDAPGPRYLEFMRAYRARHGDPAIVLLGGSNSPAAMFSEWDPKITRFVDKPCRIDEVKAAIQILFHRQAEPTDHLPPPPPGAIQLGYLSTLRLSDLLQMLCLNGWTGEIRVQNLRDDSVGSVWLDGGRLLHAEAPDGTTGENACRVMLGWARSLFRFVENTVPMTTTIASPWQHVIMEAARLADESGPAAQAG
jgi:hypothetical protein